MENTQRTYTHVRSLTQRAVSPIEVTESFKSLRTPANHDGVPVKGQFCQPIEMDATCATFSFGPAADNSSGYDNID